MGCVSHFFCTTGNAWLRYILGGRYTVIGGLCMAWGGICNTMNLVGGLANPTYILNWFSLKAHKNVN